MRQPTVNFSWAIPDGVRQIDEATYDTIVGRSLSSGVREDTAAFVVSDALQGAPESLTSGREGATVVTMGTRYERDPRLRRAAIEIHGTRCMACDFCFAETYGTHGAGFIHVHHVKPLADVGESTVDPQTDLIVLCPNCHAMVHRFRNHTLTLDELKHLMDR